MQLNNVRVNCARPLILYRDVFQYMHTVLRDLYFITSNLHHYDLVLRLLTLFSLSHPQKKAPEFPFLFLWILRAQNLLKQQVRFI